MREVSTPTRIPAKQRFRLPDWRDPGEPRERSPDVARLAAALRPYTGIVVLTGAGCSTESGIPDYRDANGGWKVGAPVIYQEFMAEPAVRRRYWARSMRGWPRFAAARPGAAHIALAELQRAGRVGSLLTQNVDGLHQQGGSGDAIELHGNLATVACLDCGHRQPRSCIQQQLQSLNPEFCGIEAELRPDGDAEIGGIALDAFRVPVCEHCAGVLKPDVVFFGEASPRERSERALRAVEEAEAMLVVGSSLAVQSGLRLCRHADALGKPLFSINLGQTRADALLQLKLEAPCGEALQQLAALL